MFRIKGIARAGQVLFLAAVIVSSPVREIGGSQAAPATAQRGAKLPVPQNPQKPSIDNLMTRANSYWSLLARGLKTQALAYVDPSCRDNFQGRRTPEFSSPRIANLAFTAKPTEVSLTVEVKRVLPLILTPLDWTVTETWTFSGGNWFVKVEKPSSLYPETPFKPAAGAAKKSAPTAEELLKRQKALKDSLTFKATTLEFGTVRQGTSASLFLEYQLTGNLSLHATIEDSPPNLATHIPDDKLAPGQGRIQLDLATKAYDGDVTESFTIKISSEGVELPYKFKIHGNVYTPISVVPMTLEFPVVMREKEIVLKNNTKSEVTIASAINVGFDVGPLPQTIPPGAECRLKVRLRLDKLNADYHGFLYLGFARPVEDLPGISIPVIVDYK